MSTPLYGDAPASGTGFVLVGESFDPHSMLPAKGSAEAAAMRAVLEHAQYEFGVLPEEYDDLFEALDVEGDDDVEVVTCQGCGAYGTKFNAEHIVRGEPCGIFL